MIFLIGIKNNGISKFFMYKLKYKRILLAKGEKMLIISLKRISAPG
jgi:hypothetical protein